MLKKEKFLRRLAKLLLHDEIKKPQGNCGGDAEGSNESEFNYSNFFPAFFDVEGLIEFCHAFYFLSFWGSRTSLGEFVMKVQSDGVRCKIRRGEPNSQHIVDTNHLEVQA